MKKAGKMNPSIFNDVIGPVMRGPSSSHTAAAHRIGSIVRQICPPEGGRVTVEFDRRGSLATTWEGQGSAMGLISGLLGLSILDRSITRYRELPAEHNMEILFSVTDYEAPHPNTYRIRVETASGKHFNFTALSTGGGMIEIVNINGFGVKLRGDCFETLIGIENLPPVKVMDLSGIIAKMNPDSEIQISENVRKESLINIKSTALLPNPVSDIPNAREIVSWSVTVNPVMPVLTGTGAPLPFKSAGEMLKFNTGKEYNLARLAIIYESARSGKSPEQVKTMMKEIAGRIRESISTGLKGTNYADRILGHQSHLIPLAEKAGKIVPSVYNTIIAYTTALMESKSAMEIIVAAPTAGSAGVLGGAFFAVAETQALGWEAVVNAFLAAGIIGVFIAGKYTFAAEEGGCQVECGAASAMAAAGIVQLLGGTAAGSVNAASMALQNMLGLVCDPVADRVEVPCLGKNILGATNALNAANMSIAGYDPVIPLDEVIDALKAVGESMPASLCCTGLGGLSVTPTARRIHEKPGKCRRD